MDETNTKKGNEGGNAGAAQGQQAGASDGQRENVAERDVDFSALDQAKAAAAGNEAGQKRENELRAEIAELKDKYLRSLAELENYKKRTLKERSDLLKYQGEPVLFDMLTVADNLERAMQHLDADPAQLKTGIELISKLFMDVLSKWDVRPIKGVGEEFDPNRFNALSRLAVADAKPGTIINELKKAYTYKDKLLRAGEVVVAAEAAPGPADGEGQAAEATENGPAGSAEKGGPVH